MSDKARPFFGDEEEPLGADLAWTPDPQPEKHTPAEWRELRIANGDCPVGACPGRLDEDFCCGFCGRVSLPRPVEPEPDEWLETFPLALRLGRGEAA